MTAENLNNIELTVYYDGLCHLCSREVEHYKRHPRSHLIRWQDITDSDFDANREQLSEQEVHRSLHSKRKNGKVVTGVDSFLAIWEVLDDYRLFRAVVGFPVVRPLFDLGYVCFAKLRVYLPKRKKDLCPDGRCSVK